MTQSELRRKNLETQMRHDQSSSFPHIFNGNNPKDLAEKCLAIITEHRRMTDSAACQTETCSCCMSPHKDLVLAAIRNEKPITFVLPAFPGKSPNTKKVLGHLPDMAEIESLKFLDNLCEKIRSYYAPGAKIVICSDGRVFSDIVKIEECHITEYQKSIEKIVKTNNLKNLSTYHLDDEGMQKSFEEVRTRLMETHGEPLSSLRARVKRGSRGSQAHEDIEAHKMYCGITKFLYEDSLFEGQTLSKTSVQKSARMRAYEVIRRSNAWSERIAALFPHAVRLSIHPQHCGSRKLGIQLLKSSPWLTPWHGVAVKQGNEVILMKRWDAEKMGLVLKHDSNGNPSHFIKAACQIQRRVS